MKKYLLYGSGGHAKVIADAISLNGDKVLCFFDEKYPYSAKVFIDAYIIIAIGNPDIRERISKEVNHKLGSVVHPQAVIASNVIIESGTVVFANAVIQANAIIGKNCIINANVVIDHDVVVEDFVSIYPGAYIGGEARITKGKIINSNTVVERKSII